MLALYRCFLYMYPAAYRQEFGDEMTAVFAEARQSTSQNSATRLQFYVREVSGLLCGAMREHLCGFLGPASSFRRFEMRPEFRFPRSTVLLMLILFAGVVLTIVKATSVELAYGIPLGTVWPSLLSVLVAMVVTMSAAAAIGWGILHSLRRSGVRRLAAMQTWPEPK